MRLTRMGTGWWAVLIVAVGLTAGVTAGSPAASGGPVLPSNCAGYLSTVSCTFRYDGTTGSDGTPQSFSVPQGVDQLVIEAWGAQGGTLQEAAGPFDEPAVGGLGGYATGTVAVTAGTALSITVGGQPTGRSGGYNGGGGAGPDTPDDQAEAGGGASDIRLGGDALADRLIVAGGGGGSVVDDMVEYGQTDGGDGGGSSGDSGGCGADGTVGLCGAGATATGGGAAGTPAASCADAGTPGLGGPGCGGGGGGGYFGGGGGGLSATGGPQSSAVIGSGGGGSAFVSPSATLASTDAGMEPGNGLVRISYASGHVYPGLHWSAPHLVDTKGGLTGVSCADRSFCVAVDSAGRATTYDGRWSKPKKVVAGSLTAVSCPTPTFCVAVGSVGAPTQNDPVIAVDSNGKWSSTVGPNAGAQEPLTGVSCVGTTFCVASGTTWEGGAPGTTAYVETYDGRSWTVVPNQDLTGYASGDLMEGVSCVSTSFCVAGGTAGDRGDIGGLVDVDESGTWTGGQIFDDRALIFQGNGMPSLEGGGIAAVACSAGNSCLVAGPAGYVWHDDGGTWTVAIADRVADVTALACPEATSCLAVDDAGNVVNDEGGTWEPALSVDPGHSLTALSCPTTRFCVIVDSDGEAVVGHS